MREDIKRYISPISAVYLPYFPPISSLYLPYISPGARGHQALLQLAYHTAGIPWLGVGVGAGVGVGHQARLEEAYHTAGILIPPLPLPLPTPTPTHPHPHPYP